MHSKMYGNLVSTGHRPVSQSSLGEGFAQVLTGTWNFSSTSIFPGKEEKGLKKMYMNAFSMSRS